MTVNELMEMKVRMERTARKWIAYLEPLRTEEAEKELTRLLCETYLEGRQAREGQDRLVP